jgi:hypothetical protein
MWLKKMVSPSSLDSSMAILFIKKTHPQTIYKYGGAGRVKEKLIYLNDISNISCPNGGDNKEELLRGRRENPRRNSKVGHKYLRGR